MNPERVDDFKTYVEIAFTDNEGYEVLVIKLSKIKARQLGLMIQEECFK